jgi:hypothetical protein
MNESSARARTLLPFSLFVLALAMTGCVGYVRGDGGVVVAEPDVFLFGGYYDRGPYREYGRRGYESRGWRR